MGSNVEPDKNIAAAFKVLGERFNMIKQASLLKTKPVGVDFTQPDFINSGCLIETELSSRELEEKLKQIETEMGRKPDTSLQPRTIDLDLLVWNGKVVDKDYYTRDFLRQIAAELLPEFAGQDQDMNIG